MPRVVLVADVVRAIAAAWAARLGGSIHLAVCGVSQLCDNKKEQLMALQSLLLSASFDCYYALVPC